MVSVAPRILSPTIVVERGLRPGVQRSPSQLDALSSVVLLAPQNPGVLSPAGRVVPLGGNSGRGLQRIWKSQCRSP